MNCFRVFFVLFFLVAENSHKYDYTKKNQNAPRTAAPPPPPPTHTHTPMIRIRVQSWTRDVRRRSVVRAFAHSAIGHHIDPSWRVYFSIPRSSHWSKTGVTNAVVSVILFMG